MLNECNDEADITLRTLSELKLCVNIKAALQFKAGGTILSTHHFITGGIRPVIFISKVTQLDLATFCCFKSDDLRYFLIHPTLHAKAKIYLYN